jgi:hypothetical protein
MGRADDVPRADLHGRFGQLARIERQAGGATRQKEKRPAWRAESTSGGDMEETKEV